jgi:hypothetical protein
LLRVTLDPGTYYAVIENEFATYADIGTSGNYSLAIFTYTSCLLDAYDLAGGNDFIEIATHITLPFYEYVHYSYKCINYSLVH